MKKNKYWLVFLCITAAISTLSSQATVAQASTAGAQEFNQIMTWVLGIGGLSVLLIGFAFIMKTNQLLYNRVLRLEAEKSGAQLPEEEPISVQDAEDAVRVSYFSKLWGTTVPIERESEIIFHHSYDGIRELDNKLPPWWVNMFFITIVWAVGYMYYYHWGGNGPSSSEEYQTSVKIAKKEIALALAGKKNAFDESNVTAVTESSDLMEGGLIFTGQCISCHGKAGEGNIGPNLTDETWIHGGGIKNVFKVIKYGVPEKGMRSWQSVLSPDDMRKVGSYILTLKGTNPPNPKAPQGTVWTETAEADTTKVQK